jgi:hypothetical protein
MTGKATIVLAGSASLAASFQTGDLSILSVSDGTADLLHQQQGAQLDVGVPSTGGDATLVIDYQFAVHDNFDGWMPAQGVTFLWPEFCGNLFPCKSDPSDGVSFEMSVTGFDPNLTAIHPTAIPGDAPSYMPAVAIADFEKIELGTTVAGTSVNVWHLPGQQSDAVAGTANLLGVFEFFEQAYGAYSFGSEVGTVSADWGGGDYGGMEHHPYWHVSSGSLYSEDVNAHEAAHGWYGNGVRIACWEDFVLSEGTATYLSARSLSTQAVDLWPDNECALRYVCESANTIALPDATCNEIDIINDPLWGPAPYYKGAYFLRAVAELIGEAVLDTALSEFYQAHVGGAARMQELIDHLKTKGDPSAIDALATAWLRTLACPVDPSTLCP